jgi:hypothetical protein
MSVSHGRFKSGFRAQKYRHHLGLGWQGFGHIQSNKGHGQSFEPLGQTAVRQIGVPSAGPSIFPSA